MPIFDAICALVIFLSAFLLFLVEPMTAKRLLPALGGSAAVWTTCLVFFQTALLAGYLYAHLLATRLRRRAQGWVHSAVLAAALTGLLVGIQPESAAASWHPLATTLWLLTALIGLPFLALAATTPLVQSWYLDGRGGAAPPWRLFALSNLGSLLALAVYPALIEPYLALRTQRLAWGAGFAIFAVACAALAWGWRGTAGMAYGDGSSSVVSHPRDGNKSRGWGTETSATPGHSSPTSSTAPTGARDAVAPLGRRALWVLLPAAGSLMLCDMTSHLSQNVAAIPLLWIVPLAAYLLSFIVTFAGPRWYARSYALRALAMAVGAIGYLLLDPDRSLPLVISIPVFTGALFVFCYFCHGELYRLRPDARQTTSFYLLLSLGSALGAIAAGVIAPALFRANYDLALGLIVLVALAVAARWKTGIAARLFWSGAACALIAVAAVSIRALDRHSIAQLRSFYGSLRVTETFAVPNIGIERTLYHGTIEHGIQIFNDELRMQPTSYYAADSGVGLALRLCCGGRMRRIGAVGLSGHHCRLRPSRRCAQFLRDRSAGGAAGTGTLHLFAREPRPGERGAGRCTLVIGTRGAADIRRAGARCFLRRRCAGAPAHHAVHGGVSPPSQGWRRAGVSYFQPICEPGAGAGCASARRRHDRRVCAFEWKRCAGRIPGGLGADVGGFSLVQAVGDGRGCTAADRRRAHRSVDRRLQQPVAADSVDRAEECQRFRSLMR